MAIINNKVKKLSNDRDENIFIGIDLPFQKSDSNEGWFKSTKTTFDAVKTKLDQPIPLGYSNAGVVIDTNDNNYNIGDRVVSNGSHAEVVSAGRNLCAKIPEQVDDESASFTVLGSIALESIRLVNPSLGENVAVFGLGLIGLLSVQMLKANGCRVLAVDPDIDRCKIVSLTIFRLFQLLVFVS